MNPKQIRIQAGLSRAHVAAKAGLNEATAKIYELSPDAVSPRSREALDRVYDQLKELKAPNL